jgi:hypothetical protein
MFMGWCLIKQRDNFTLQRFCYCIGAIEILLSAASIILLQQATQPIALGQRVASEDILSEISFNPFPGKAMIRG